MEKGAKGARGVCGRVKPSRAKPGCTVSEPVKGKLYNSITIPTYVLSLALGVGKVRGGGCHEHVKVKSCVFFTLLF